MSKKKNDDGEISQDEIDALLSGSDFDVSDSFEIIDSASGDFKSCEPKSATSDSADSKAAVPTDPEKEFKLKEERYKKYRKKHPISRDEVLSQDEIDQLLNAISNGSDDDDDFNDDDGKEERRTRRIKIYDFKRPDRFSKEQIHRVCYIFECVCREMTTYFSEKLRSLCHFYVASVDQITYEEFLRSIPTPTTLASAKWEDECAVLEIDPCLTFKFLYSLYSDKIEKIEAHLLETDLKEEQICDVMDTIKGEFGCTRINRDLESGELFFMKNMVARPIYKMITEQFNDWQGKVVFYNISAKDEKLASEPIKRPTKIRMETNPQFAQVTAPNEMVLLVTIEGKIQDEEGMINVCFPYPFVKEVLIKRNVFMNKEDLDDFSLEVVPGNSGVSLGDFNMKAGAKLEEGTIIELNKLAGEPVDLFDKKTGKIFAKGEVVVIDENFGVRVTEVLEK